MNNQHHILKTDHTGLVILAAGASTRIGKPKQLLSYKRITLLERAIVTAAASRAQNMVVVLGAHAAQIINKVALHHAPIRVNARWQEGMASSIRCGLEALRVMQPQLDGAVIMLCDQPCVSCALINELIHTGQSSGKMIAASAYGDAVGVPAWFHKSVFPELMQLSGDQGARMVIQRGINDCAKVAFPKGCIDIDTDTDYNILIQNRMMA